jgi:hypothetical protein
MNTNRPINGIVEPAGRDVIARESTQAMVLAGRERIQDLVRNTSMAIQEVMREVRETIQRCEAELEIEEELNVVVEAGKTIYSVKRSLRFAKDRP